MPPPYETFQFKQNKQNTVNMNIKLNIFYYYYYINDKKYCLIPVPKSIILIIDTIDQIKKDL